METLTIGLISDTHGVLRPEARVALRGCAHILHAGDICDPAVLRQLEEIAPVTAVRGNNDRGTWAEALPAHAVVEFAGVRVCVVHDLADYRVPAPDEARHDVVVTGHSHRPAIRMEGGVLYVNPLSLIHI